MSSNTTPSKPKPTRALPTNRIAFEKQKELLRAWGVASGPERKPVTNKTIAQMLGMNESTTFYLNTFLQDLDLLSRGEGGLVASPDLVAYAAAAKWDENTAGHKLARPLIMSWFGKALLHRLSFRPMEEDKAIADLGQAAAAGPEYRAQIKMCIDYLEYVGLVERDGAMLREGPMMKATPNEEVTPPPPPPLPEG